MHYFIIWISIVDILFIGFHILMIAFLDNCSSTFSYLYVIPLFLVLIVASHNSAFVGVLHGVCSIDLFHLEGKKSSSF